MDVLISWAFIILVVIILISIREVKQYQRGVKFSFGKFTSLVQPGWRLVIPIFQKMTKVDIRVKAVDVPDQEAITEDNISISINAVIYYKVSDSAKESPRDFPENSRNNFSDISRREIPRFFCATPCAAVGATR